MRLDGSSHDRTSTILPVRLAGHCDLHDVVVTMTVRIVAFPVNLSVLLSTKGWIMQPSKIQCLTIKSKLISDIFMINSSCPLKSKNVIKEKSNLSSLALVSFHELFSV